ncbi:hypothetical protein [Bifidobacterium scardovii]|uniref:Ssb2 n=1 Tax=Bifidobacterium scardovii TaxID=158787 RepID=A0A087DI60_9BIFI|nr:hypothetical protein [Bifidobacterium scardovii]KFI95210.1 ssb2 [Bifidobacterium scardovii]MDK6348709.1 hypothetical protein [Bifidobacterium scardovii]MDU8981313.1 hypothetical protein [Bifidobacterium scardovii]BAQ31595.1 putative truncated single-strand DNA-binding protein [Bifidobacterium scardovii JCM 12489 = DSM 13734]
MWRDLADHINCSFAKGDQVLATVHPKTETYQRQDGSTAWSVKWVVDDIGPSLLRATAQITRFKRGQAPSRQPMQPAQSVPSEPTGFDEFTNDPWN